MGETGRVVHCGDCGMQLPSDWVSSEEKKICPKCGSNRQDVSLSIFDKLTVAASVRGKVKDDSFSSKQKVRKDFFYGDDVRKKDGKWMKKERIIDKDADCYKEVVTDPSSGEVVHKTEEPLSEHRGHGSAKRKQDTGTEAT